MTQAAKEQTEQGSVDFGHALGTLFRAYLESAREAVGELPGGHRGFKVMSIASGSACSNQAAIADSLGLDRTVMTYLVDDLEKAGLVKRRPDPADRRARQVLLTQKGAAAFEDASERINHVERQLLGGLSEDEAAVFRNLLTRVVADAPPDTGQACKGPESAC